ncbi:hypothetical protein DW061_09705 [Ruminococcus sp. AF42-9BH]|nr:hypothetical protein DW061_09705 [Ruminococcus sp. AF42-9BH]
MCPTDRHPALSWTRYHKGYSPMRTTKNWVKSALVLPNLVKLYQPIWHKKTPENLDFPGFCKPFDIV